MPGLQRKIVSMALMALVPAMGAAAATPVRQAKKPAVAVPASVVVPTSVAAPTDEPRAKPIGNPADWFPASAYPPEARNAGQEGRTVFRLKLDARARVIECDIVQSSGSMLLDNTTCDLVVTNGRFTPAHDADGKPVAGVWQSAMRWQLIAGGPTVDADSQ